MNTNDHDNLVKLFSGAEKEFDIQNEDDYYGECDDDKKYSKKAINKAYRDFTPRTLKKVGTGSKPEVKKDRALKYLRDRFVEYFNSPNAVDSFLEWHAQTCEEFKRIFNEDNRGQYEAIAYGKAQKIVNMTFKYLYCYQGAEEFEEKFNECHMALDKFTLHWFTRVVIPEVNRNKSKRDKIKVMQINNTSWSNLEKGSETAQNSYLWIQKLIRDYFEEKNVTPFKAEFKIWNEERIILAGKSWIDQIKDEDKVKLDQNTNAFNIGKEVLINTLTYLTNITEEENIEEMVSILENAKSKLL